MSEIQNITPGLVPVGEYKGKQAVSGRELHEFLQVGAEYRHWFPRMVAYGFLEGHDYAVISDRVARDKRGEVERVDHALTLDMAKELGMIQRTELGRRIRQYFIEVEKRAQAPAELSTLQIIELAREAELGRIAAEQQVAELAPKAAHTDTMREADGLRTIQDLANDLKVHAASNYPGLKVLQADVFDLAGVVGLIVRGNTVRNNQPTARAIDAQWVKPKDTKVDTNNHGSFVKVSARLTPRGYGRLWDAAVTNLKMHGQVLAPKKEIAA